uniref:VWFA domain-containing protein n=1 Tax=Haptolina brevifila TaxID=156173 RepID=A0A7S2FWU2_9EUKA|mmetsp:Transcript_21402/g.43304  ORF Transcript_21402/g.43304 Transcript_21402/m.43304 type:complete len:669 (+) Transcript_21402:72-2078(+)|eukprot:CAMPEP_0174725024 /NCGR_PEP_ID=MMETSP1094-20130205/44644_1 /TAXON_ID=156173 /ORGANISM="Chrysochromulina brevifilum, Strain UTEX LB 985" /LENGTH=668 /DNA_ID=CAMNT_0015926337 /DNA_START=62 /DNA_END=2068 /DNA_ORIENTATION=-
MSSLSLTKMDDGFMATIVPPQTIDDNISVGKGAYCFVIDVSGSMNAAASITTDDGDKVNHGWSQLDIAKHSTNTFVSSLEDDDYFSVVTYSDHANVLVDWTRCNESGRERCIAAIHSMQPERTTNLMAGITTGFDMFDKLPENDGSLSGYALNLVVTTDGMPSSQWHPARGLKGYAPLVNSLKTKLTKKRGEAARPTITTIGIGFQLDSSLLLQMSETFLHMPDPGQIGPFIVNLLASARSTARLPDPSGRAANSTALIVSGATPSSVPGYACEGHKDGLKIKLGAMLYDQQRHVILKTAPGADITLSLVVGEEKVLSKSSTDGCAQDEASIKQAAIEQIRIDAILAIQEALALGDGDAGEATMVACLDRFIQQARASPVVADPVVAALIATVEKECKLGCNQANFKRWGAHYFRTLPCMLQAERRSNFRDECMQHFGKDKHNREALFEEQSNAAEMRFATLKPPEPSLLRASQPAPPTAASAGSRMPAAPPPRPTLAALPDEFMRGGGCFGPNSTVRVTLGNGEAHAIKVSQVRAGDGVVGEDGRVAIVRCVVKTECPGGRAMLTRLPSGPELTEWHPVRDSSGRWRFPIMLGERVVVSTQFVYNFVLSPGHPTIMVDGLPCAALGHGLDAPVVSHPYWGTRAVIDDLMSKEGWAVGHVVLSAKENV